MDKLDWSDVPAEVVRLVKAASPVVTALRKHRAADDVLIDIDAKLAFAHIDPGTVRALQECGICTAGTERLQEPLLRIKAADIPLHHAIGPISEVFGLREGPVNAIWGGPRPLATTLAGSALGAGAGYGAGWLMEKLLPVFERRRLRKTLATLGGAVGAVPGLYQSLDNMSLGHSVLDTWPKESSMLERAEQFLGGEKVADFDTSAFAPNFNPIIDRARLDEMLRSDPFMSAPLAAATDGLLTAAALPQGGGNLVSPWDVARIAAGMGSGLVSGLLVGKTLGALTGLSPGAQQALTRGGVIAGLVKSVVPMAFGR